jgi:hypothetical protein
MDFGKRESVYETVPYLQVPLPILAFGYTGLFIRSIERRVAALSTRRSACTAQADAA